MSRSIVTAGGITRMTARTQLIVWLGTAALLLTDARALQAQSSWASKGPVVHGHYHLNITDKAAHEKFWGTVLGGVRTPFPTGTVFKFPDALVVLTRSEEHTSELQSLRHLVC